MPPRLTPETIAMDFLANRFIDLAAAFARRDQGLAIAFLDEAEQRIAADLDSLPASFRRHGSAAEGTRILAAAGKTLRAVILEAKSKARQPPQ